MLLQVKTADWLSDMVSQLETQARQASTAQHSTAQHSTAQHSTARHHQAARCLPACTCLRSQVCEHAQSPLATPAACPCPALPCYTLQVEHFEADIEALGPQKGKTKPPRRVCKRGPFCRSLLLVLLPAQSLDLCSVPASAPAANRPSPPPPPAPAPMLSGNDIGAG